MIGATVKNIRRTGISASKRGVPNPEYGPTLQRLAMAQGNVSIGDDKQGGKTYTMRDSPLDRAHKKGIISGAEHSALQKYRHHWYHAGQAPTISSLDPAPLAANLVLLAPADVALSLPRTYSAR